MKYLAARLPFWRRQLLFASSNFISFLSMLISRWNGLIALSIFSRVFLRLLQFSVRFLFVPAVAVAVVVLLLVLVVVVHQTVVLSARFPAVVLPVVCFAVLLVVPAAALVEVFILISRWCFFFRRLVGADSGFVVVAHPPPRPVPLLLRGEFWSIFFLVVR